MTGHPGDFATNGCIGTWNSCLWKYLSLCDCFFGVPAAALSPSLLLLWGAPVLDLTCCWQSHCWFIEFQMMSFRMFSRFLSKNQERQRNVIRQVPTHPTHVAVDKQFPVILARPHRWLRPSDTNPSGRGAAHWNGGAS